MKFSIILLLLLSGCATIFDQSLDIPENTLKSCQNIPLAKSSQDKDLLEQSKETIKLYHECKKWNEEKATILRKLKK